MRRGSKDSCLVVIDERGSIVANSFAGTVQEIAEAIEGYAAERRGVLLGVDAPLAVPNERGTRGIERILSKVALPSYSASRKMFGGELYSEELLEELEKEGIVSTRTTRSGGRGARRWPSRSTRPRP